MREEAVPSPCNTVCTLDRTGRLCIGCGRTLDEIGIWAAASPERKLQIIADAAARLNAGTSA